MQIEQQANAVRPSILFFPAALMLSIATSAFAQWDLGDSGTKASLRAIHNSGGGVAWAGGTNGVVLRSEDDGYVWQQCAIPPDAGNLDFRGVWGWDANHAMAMSSGPGSDSRLYETRDGCAHWQPVLTNRESTGFWDAIRFWNARQGMLLGDPVNGRFVILRTGDRGQHWTRDESPGLAADPQGESAFAGSNSALALSPDGSSAYFGTGGPGGARIFRLAHGKWTAVRLPFSRGTESAGIFSVHFRDAKRAVAVGGDYKHPNQRENTAAWTSDAGLTWTSASQPPSGYRSAAAWYPKAQAWLAVGPNGSDASYDDGITWMPFDKTAWNALSLPWAVGAEGKIGMLNDIARNGRNSSSSR